MVTLPDIFGSAHNCHLFSYKKRIFEFFKEKFPEPCKAQVGIF